MKAGVDTAPKRRAFFRTKSLEERDARKVLTTARRNWVKALKRGSPDEKQKTEAEYTEALKRVSGLIAQERGAAAAAQFDFNEKSIFGAKNRERLWQNKFVRALSYTALGVALVALGITLSAVSLPALATALTTFGKVLTPKILAGLAVSLTFGLAAGLTMGELLAQGVFIKRAARREGISPALLTKENYSRALADAERAVKQGVSWEEFQKTQSGKIIRAMTRVNVFKNRTRVATGLASTAGAFSLFHHGWGSEIIARFYGSTHGADTMFASVSEIDAARGVMRAIGDRFAEFFVLIASLSPVTDAQAKPKGGNNNNGTRGRDRGGRNNRDRYARRDRGHSPNSKPDRGHRSRTNRWRKLIMAGLYIMMYDEATGKMSRHLVTENDPLLDNVPDNVEIYPDRPTIPPDQLYSEIKKNGRYFAVINKDGTYSIFRLDNTTGKAELVGVTDYADLTRVDERNEYKDILLLTPEEMKGLSAADQKVIAENQKRLGTGKMPEGKDAIPVASREETKDLFVLCDVKDWKVENQQFDPVKEVNRMLSTLLKTVGGESQNYVEWFNTYFLSDFTWGGKKFKTAYILGGENRTSLHEIIKLICGTDASYTRAAQVIMAVLNIDDSFNTLPLHERHEILGELYENFDAHDYGGDGKVDSGSWRFSRIPEYVMMIALIDMLHDPEALRARCPKFYAYMRTLINNHPVLRQIIAVK
ncbi:MAG: hypothetical protein RLZZ283_319 [Candidatus Parcubacteria bacterium]|jgi:hypothetical protein